MTRQAGERGPLDARTTPLLKLAVAMGCMREGAVHSAVRKAMASGATKKEIEQVIALAASTVGFPSAVALHSWCFDLLEPSAKRR